MPTYLRWIAAITSGIVAQFAFFIVVGAILVGTDRQQVDLNGGIGLLVTLGSTFVGVLPALAVNDWLAKRYPPDDRRTQGARTNAGRDATGPS